jgi:hypothetical protein
MRRFVLPMMVLSLAIAPAALEAQQQGAARGMQGARAQMAHGGMGMRAGGAMNPAARILAQREALGLTSDQVRQLEAVQTRLEAQNQPLAEQMRAAAVERGGERPAAGRPGAGMRGEGMRGEGMRQQQEMTAEQRAGMAALRPAMAQLQANAAQARADVQSILTVAQRTQLQELNRARMSEMRSRMDAVRGEHGERGMQGARGERGMQGARRGPAPR